MESEEKPEGEKAKNKDKAKAKGSRKRREPKPPLQSDMPLDEGMPEMSKPGLPKAEGKEPPSSGPEAGPTQSDKESLKKSSKKTGAKRPTRVAEIMTEDPVCCTPATPLVRVARMMAENSCGAIPVIRSPDDRVPVGIITDRDVAVRTVAMGKNPLEMTAGDVMTDSPVTVHPEDPVEECAAAMRGYKLRRIVVVDGNGRVCGLVVQAQIARYLPREESGEIVRDISQPPL